MEKWKLFIKYVVWDPCGKPCIIMLIQALIGSIFFVSKASKTLCFAQGLVHLYRMLNTPLDVTLALP